MMNSLPGPEGSGKIDRASIVLRGVEETWSLTEKTPAKFRKLERGFTGNPNGANQGLQVAQELLLQPAQPVLLPATTRPPLVALNSDNIRDVFELSHTRQLIGASASFINRIVSKRLPHSRQTYS